MRCFTFFFFFGKPLIKTKKNRQIICKGSKQCKICLREYCIRNGEAHQRCCGWRSVQWGTPLCCIPVSCSSSLPCCCSDSCTVTDTSTTCSSAGKAAQTLPKWAGAVVEWQAQPLYAPGLETNVWDATRVSRWCTLTRQHSPSVRAWAPSGGMEGLPWAGPTSSWARAPCWRQAGAAGLFCQQHGAGLWGGRPEGSYVMDSPGDRGRWDAFLLPGQRAAAQLALQCSPQPWVPAEQPRQGAGIL